MSAERTAPDRRHRTPWREVNVAAHPLSMLDLSLRMSRRTLRLSSAAISKRIAAALARPPPVAQSPRPTRYASVASRASATIVTSSVGSCSRIRSASGERRTRSSALDVRCGITSRVTRRDFANWTTPSAASFASIRTTSAPRSVASSRYSRMRRFSSDGAAARRCGLDPQRDEWRAQDGRRRRRATERSRCRRRRVHQDEDAFAQRPGRRTDALELRVDPAGDEPQRQLAQRGQVRLGEEAIERDTRPIRRVDVAMAHPLAERVRAHVDEFDLVRRGEHLVRDPLVDRGAGDRRDRIGDGVQVLDVAGADDVDPGVEQDVDVLPALGARRTRGVGVGKLVDQGDRGMAREDGVACPSPRRRHPGTRSVGEGRSRGRSSSFSVSGRPCASTKPTTRSVPRAVRRCPSSSIR